MTSNVDRSATPKISVAEYNLMVQQQESGGAAPTSAARGGPRRASKPDKPAGKTPRKRSSTPPAPRKRSSTPPAARKRAQRGISPGLAPAAAASRGPWTISVDYLGRPLTMNDERASVMHPGTMAAVREDKRVWQAGFVEGIRHVGVPPQRRVFVVHQLYYPNNVVPDPDAFGPSAKAVHDSLVEAGVLPNDKRRNLPFGYFPLPPVTDGGVPRMAFTIFPLPED